MQGKKIISLVLMVCLLTPSPAAWTQEGPAGPTGPAGPGMGTGAPSAPAAGPTGPAAAPAPGSPADLSSQAQFYLQRVSPTTGTPEIQRVAPAPSPEVQPTPQQPVPDRTETEPGVAEEAEEFTELQHRARVRGLNLRLFGYDFFRRAPSTFLPVMQVPVGPDYLIGPGDTIRVVLWGAVQAEYNMTVDRNGQIAIPRVGVVSVSGLTFRQLREVLDREFSRQYTNFQMNVTLDNLRTITVYVVGQARRPGSYSISSLSTLVNALFASGGPSRQGSMRRIEVRRGGRTIVRFDMYDFLLRGDKTKDIRLMPEDVIFIPVAGERVGLGGPVKIPAVYELKEEKTLSELIHLAGGLAPTAFKNRVQMMRIRDRKEMILVEDDLELFLSGLRPDIPLAAGDLVRIFPVPSVDIRLVRVGGAVQNPGEFGYRDGMRLSDLIVFAGGFLLSTNLDEAEITRVTPSPEGPITTRQTVNLRLAMAGNTRENVLLRPNDFLLVRHIPEWALYQMVSVGGEVRYPGAYTIKKGETLSSVLTRAGGFATNAYPKGAFFSRVSVKQEQTRHLNQAIDRMEADMLAAGAARAQTEIDPKEVQRYALVQQQQRALIAKLREIIPLGRVVVRMDDPERLRGTPWDLELQEGDSLHIPQVQQTVNVLGSVLNPTAIVYDPHLSVNDYIRRAGGLGKNADAKQIFVIKASGAAVSRQSFRWFGGGWTGSEETFHVGSIKSLRLDPGDTIIVPEDFERIAWLREIKDIATILGQVALVAAVVVAASK
ncbi:MAG: polysaccharide export protein [Deltaproteobacteria bacterium]|nr:polysaccharide export protein [Deltaproteobacteria bacterium]